MVAKAVPLTVGEVFGRLTVQSEPYTKGRYRFVTVLCSCGSAKEVEQSNLRSGRVNSCGCLNKEIASKRFTTHGKSMSPIYAVWNVMVQRCHTPTNRQYVDYGGRGITVCDSWKVFENFYADMGDPPFSGASLERLDNDAGYTKGNVVWATRKEQNNHTRRSVRFKVGDRSITMAEAAAECGININTLTTRVYRYGMSMEEAMLMPVMSPEKSGALAGKPILTEVNRRVDGFNPF